MAKPRSDVVLLIALFFGGSTAVLLATGAHYLAYIMCNMGIFMWACLKWSKADRMNLTKADSINVLVMLITFSLMAIPSLFDIAKALVHGRASIKDISVLVFVATAVYKIWPEIPNILRPFKSTELRRF